MRRRYLLCCLAFAPGLTGCETIRNGFNLDLTERTQPSQGPSGPNSSPNNGRSTDENQRPLTTASVWQGGDQTAGAQTPFDRRTSRTGTEPTPEATAAAIRVTQLHRKLAERNPELRSQPSITVANIPEVAIGYRGGQQLIVSDGFLIACRNDQEVMAALAYKLAEMEVEGYAQDRFRDPEPPHAPAVRDNTGFGQSLDYGREAELAKFQKSHGRGKRNRDPVTDAVSFARTLLVGADVPAATLDRVMPIIRQGEKSTKLDGLLGRFVPKS